MYIVRTSTNSSPKPRKPAPRSTKIPKTCFGETGSARSSIPMDTSGASRLESAISTLARCRNRNRSLEILDHLAANDQPLDLAGALVDLGDLSVAIMTFYRIILDVAVAAMDLNGLIGHEHRDLGGEELGHGGLFVDRSPLI